MRCEAVVWGHHAVYVLTQARQERILVRVSLTYCNCEGGQDELLYLKLLDVRQLLATTFIRVHLNTYVLPFRHYRWGVAALIGPAQGLYAALVGRTYLSAAAKYELELLCR